MPATTVPMQRAVLQALYNMRARLLSYKDADQGVGVALLDREIRIGEETLARLEVDNRKRSGRADRVHA